MSRGPGRIQRALVAAFAADPCAVLNAEEMIELAFPGLEHLPKHRVSTLRAARKLAESSNRYETCRGAPNDGEFLLFHAANVRSLAVARVYRHLAGTRSLSECTAIVDDPTTEAYREAQPDGFFDLTARLNELWADGKDDEASVLNAQILERIALSERDRSAATTHQQQAAP